MSTLFLRLALAFSFLYPAYGFWKHPVDWIGYVPSFVKGVGIPEATLFLLLTVFHTVLALWLLSGWRTFISSILAALFLFGVVYFNLNQLDILFRDISLALAALALALQSRHT